MDMVKELTDRHALRCRPTVWRTSKLSRVGDPAGRAWKVT